MDDRDRDREGRDRDRDARGRARNARPRDATGRPLRRDDPGVEGPPEIVVLDPGSALTEAQRLLDADRPFHAHEVLESAWKASDGDERAMWQALAQLAVGLTHAQRGNATGAASLLERCAERIAPFETDRPHGVDVAAIVRYSTALAARVRAGGLDDLTENDRRPRLLGGIGGGGDSGSG
jgi:hypothetical protein